MTRTQITNTLLMVAPADFGFNAETAGNNEFQHRPTLAQENLREQVAVEFAQAVRDIRAAGVSVLVLDKSPDLAELPDAVFPNNWFATEPAGQAYIFQMASANRQAETGQWPALENLLAKNGIPVHSTMRMDAPEAPVLEGTGSLVLDRVNKVAYAAISVRTEPAAVEMWAATAGYETLYFHTESRGGQPFYHTNVVMAIGQGFAVVCLEAVPDEGERLALKTSLTAQGLEVIEVSLAQAEESFCANILQARGDQGPVTIMSRSAYEGFTAEQRTKLERYGALLPISIPTIEHVGGGSARCMLAEVFQ